MVSSQRAHALPLEGLASVSDRKSPARPSGELLLVDCQDRRGLVHEITGALCRRGANILTNYEFVDHETQRFFMRTEFIDADDCASAMREIVDALPSGARIRHVAPTNRRVVILATREPHCLGELLLRYLYGELGASIEGVVSNHEALGDLVARLGVPFHHIPHVGIDRAEHEARVLNVVESYSPDYLVLAKYMRILSRRFIDRYQNRIINIHHSFLPAFVGSNPYRQAFQRGVKIIGATAHFVTEELDQGPIIAQDVLPVDHGASPSDMARAGRDVEKIVLARALKLIFEERVFLSGNRTIVFE